MYFAHAGRYAAKNRRFNFSTDTQKLFINVPVMRVNQIARRVQSVQKSLLTVTQSIDCESYLLATLFLSKITFLFFRFRFGLI